MDSRLITPVIAGLLQSAEHKLLIDRAPLGLIHSDSLETRQKTLQVQKNDRNKKSPVKPNLHGRIICHNHGHRHRGRQSFQVNTDRGDSLSLKMLD